MARPKKTDIDKKIEQACAQNRQINYYVMRKVWGMLRPRGNTTVYDALGILRERYTRAIDTGRIQLTEKELLDLVQETGIRAEIFEGRTHFCIEGVSEDAWKELFELRAGKRHADVTSKEIDTKKYKKVEHAVEEKIRTCNRNDLIGNRDFWTLCYYAKHGERFSGNLLATQAVEAIKVIGEISFDEFDVYETDQLVSIRSVLMQQLEKVDAIVNYRNMKTP